MNEKIMINDVLKLVKEELRKYQEAIIQAENIQLRQTLQKIRNNNEALQYELYKVAKVKGHYQEKEMASDKEIKQVKSELEEIG